MTGNRIKALVKKEACKGLWLEDVPAPETGINDVLIKVKRAAICGTDMHIYNWDDWAQKTIPVPMVVGHEFVGEVVEVGSNVNGFDTGQIVSRGSCGVRPLPYADMRVPAML
jgi:threonine 3-dehydrogenase